MLVGDEFTIAVLPDTQLYAQDHEDIFSAQTQWLRDHRVDHNIVFVTHVGDIVNEDEPAQWQAADRSMSLLDGVIPYGFSVGNHDMNCDEGDMRLFEKTFGADRYASTPWTVATFRNHTASAQVFDAAGKTFLIVHLPCNAPDAYLNWADDVLERYPDHPAIITTHMYLGAYSEPFDDQVGRMVWKKCFGEAGNTAEQMWQKSFRKHANLLMILSGDQSRVQTLTQRSVGEHGNVVYALMSDYKRAEGTTSGYLRLLRFYPGQERIVVSTFSPSLERFAEGTEIAPRVSQHNFVLPLGNKWLGLETSRVWTTSKEL